MERIKRDLKQERMKYGENTDILGHLDLRVAQE
jgi:hypothetical protein